MSMISITNLSDKEKKEVLEKYNKGIQVEKDILIELFGEDAFTLDIIDKIKTFEDAYNEVKVKKNLPEWLQDLVKYDNCGDVPKWLRIFIIVNALNEGWEADWENSEEYKYYVWMEFVKGKGWVFDVSGCFYSCSVAGSRLVYPKKSLSDYAGVQFETECGYFFSNK